MHFMPEWCWIPSSYTNKAFHGLGDKLRTEYRYALGFKSFMVIPKSSFGCTSVCLKGTTHLHDNVNVILEPWKSLSHLKAHHESKNLSPLDPFYLIHGEGMPPTSYLQELKGMFENSSKSALIRKILTRWDIRCLQTLRAVLIGFRSIRMVLL